MNLWLLTQALNVTLIMRAKTFSVNQLEIFLLVCVLISSVVRQLRVVHLLQSVEIFKTAIFPS